MTMAFTCAKWHENHTRPVFKSVVSPATLHARWKCDRDGIPRCHWDIGPSGQYFTLSSGPSRSLAALELVR